MISDAGEELRRVKYELQFYKDLAKEQAGQIAALKAEIAYVKQHPQPQTSAAAPPAQPQASGSRATSTVKRPDSPPPSVAGSSNDPYIIDDDEELEEVVLKAPESPPRRADSQSNKIHPNKVPLQQMQSIKSPPRSPEKLPKKRTSSPAAGTGRYFPEYEPSSSSRRWGQGDSPRKKPRLVPEVESPSVPVVEDDPVAGSSNISPDIDTFQNDLVAGPPNTQDLESGRPEAAGPSSTQHDLDALENGPVAGLSNTQRDFDDEWDMSPLSSLPSTPSRSSSPANDNLEDQARDETTHLLRSASRELSYHDPSAVNEREARLGQASQVQYPIVSTAGLVAQGLISVELHISSLAAAVRRARLAGIAPYDVALSDPAISNVSVNRKQLGSIYGGSLMRMCTQAAGRNFLFPGLELNPFLPRTAGTAGLLIRSNGALQWQKGVQTVFVGLRPGEYVYCGQYLLKETEALTAEEYCGLSSKVKKKWADSLMKKPKFKDVRVRIATRRDHRREATFQEVDAVVKDKSDAYRGHVSEQEIIGAYERGEERLLMFKMKCVGYDEYFLKDLVSKL